MPVLRTPNRADVVALASRCAISIADSYVSSADGRSGWSKYYLKSPDEIGIWGTSNGIEGLFLANKLRLDVGLSRREVQEMIVGGLEFLSRQQLKEDESRGAWSITQLAAPPFVDSTAIALRAFIQAGNHEFYSCIYDGLKWLVKCSLPSGGWSYLERGLAERAVPKTCPTAYALLSLHLGRSLDIWSGAELTTITDTIEKAVDLLKRSIVPRPRSPASYGWGRELGAGKPNPAYTLVAIMALRALDEVALLESYSSGLVQLIADAKTSSFTGQFDQAPWQPVRDIWTPPAPLTERFLVFFTTAFVVSALAGLGLRDSRSLVDLAMEWLTVADKGGRFYDYQNLPRMFTGVDALRACDVYLNAIGDTASETTTREPAFGQAAARRHKILISYKRDDCDEFASWLARRLREEGVDPWFDNWNLKPGDSLTEKLEKAFESTHACVILLTPKYMSGAWSTREMQTAITHSLKGNYRVIPIVVRDCEIPRLLEDLVRVYFISDEPVEREKSFQQLLVGIT